MFGKCVSSQRDVLVKPIYRANGRKSYAIVLSQQGVVCAYSFITRMENVYRNVNENDGVRIIIWHRYPYEDRSVKKEF